MEVSLSFYDETLSLEIEGDVDVLVPPRAEAPTSPDLAALARRAVKALPRVPERPVLVVPDRTRNARLPDVLPPLFDALEEAGAPTDKIPCVFASGTHRPMSEAQMRAALGPLFSRVRARSHDCDAPDLVALGEGPDGAPVLVAPEVASADAIIVVSAMAFHYLAGFGGGRKMLLPGVCDRRTTLAIHATCLSRDPPGRAALAAPGVLDENPLHQAIVARLSGLPPAVGLCVVPGSEGVALAEAGSLLSHHARLAERFANDRTVTRAAPLDGVLLSAGGAPYDVDLVQAHKSLVAIAPLLRPGARVGWIARCPLGGGHDDFFSWVTSGSADEQLERLLASFHIGRQTAWSLRSLLERFEVGMLTDLSREEVARMGATVLRCVDEAWSFVRSAGPRVAVAPAGAAYVYRVQPPKPTSSTSRGSKGPGSMTTR